MLDDKYCRQVQNELTHHYIDKVSNRDEHRVTVFTNYYSDNALITYHPYNLDNHDDNDGKLTPVRDLVVEAVANHGQWTSFINRQFIHQDVNGALNFNFRFDNAITDQGYHRLSKDLKRRFQIKITSDGRLVSVINHKVVNAFARLIKSIQFVNANGHNYVDNAYYLRTK